MNDNNVSLEDDGKLKIVLSDSKWAGIDNTATIETIKEEFSKSSSELKNKIKSFASNSTDWDLSLNNGSYDQKIASFIVTFTKEGETPVSLNIKFQNVSIISPKWKEDNFGDDNNVF